MSFAYLPLFTGDYLRDTQHLSLTEHGAYLKLLMHCWDQKGPAPLDDRKLYGICNARSKEEMSAVLHILEEFFVRMDDGWYNRRLQREVEKSEAISRARATAGRLGFEARAKHLPSKSQASAKQVHLSPSPSPSLSLSPSSSSSPETQKQKSKDCAPTAPSGVSESVWNDFQKVRKALHAPITPTALKGIEREALKAGMSLEAALQVCCERSWRGFKAEWMKNAPVGKEGQADRVAEILFGKGA